jgi:hypothetical protein
MTPGDRPQAYFPIKHSFIRLLFPSFVKVSLLLLRMRVDPSKDFLVINRRPAATRTDSGHSHTPQNIAGVLLRGERVRFTKEHPDSTSVPFVRTRCPRDPISPIERAIYTGPIRSQPNPTSTSHARGSVAIAMSYLQLCVHLTLPICNSPSHALPKEAISSNES